MRTTGQDMRRLETALQTYAWGKCGSDSMVAQLKKSEDPDFDVEEGQTFAELWMGTHPNGPSRVMRDGHEGTSELQGLYGSAQSPGMFLIELLETYPHYLGDQAAIGDLPFMFKVLSINKALSIQAHPDKKLAERLYATRPDLYKDDNHKPEMAVALSDFEGLCGFRPFREIVYNLDIYPELRAMVGAEATAQVFACTSGVREDEESALRVLFRAFVTANTNVVSAQVNAMVTRLRGDIHANRAGEMPGEGGESGGEVVTGGGARTWKVGRFQAAEPGDGNCDGSFGCEDECDGHCSNSSGSNVGEALPGCRRSCPSFGNLSGSRHGPAGPGNGDVDAFCEDGEGEQDTVAAEVRREEVGLEYVDAVAVGRKGSSSSSSSGCSNSSRITVEDVHMPLHVGCGASYDTADGEATDHEDATTEDDSTSLAQHQLHSDDNDRASNASSSSNLSMDNHSASDTDAHGNGNSNAASGDSGTGSNLAGGVAARIIARGRGYLATTQQRAEAAPMAEARAPPSPRPAFRRRGWSSSKLASPSGASAGGVTSGRRACEDLALQALILRLADEYPGDIGIMMPLMLNYLRMGEGESFFMAANEPHAYLKGDILEVMARSDNVVRVALTPKHRDVPMLCEILTYHMGAPPIVVPVAVDECCSRYTPPIEDFEMLNIEVPHGQEYATPPVSVAALAIVMAGAGFACGGNGRQRLRRGMAFFIPAKTSMVYTNDDSDCGEGGAGSGGTLWVCMARPNLNYRRPV